MASTPGATAQRGFVADRTLADPFCYQTGFGNRFESEAIPGVLPRGRNTPQKCKYDLYSEQLNGSSVVASRADTKHVWMYRMRPSATHGPIVPAPEVNDTLETCFLPLNGKVKFIASHQAWNPFPLFVPAGGYSYRGEDFLGGISTIGGQGDASLREGIAIHIYSCSISMGNRAFANHDGELLILPQVGKLHIKTELGSMMVRPGELAVMPAGIRFNVSLPDGPSRGYIQEIFGAHYQLPELGPLGSNGMALPRDFESPVASFDIDSSLWEIIYKTAGTLQRCEQDHTPFDVVAWHGNLVPYKYALEKFVNVANANFDQTDPTAYCILTAPSKVPGAPLADFLTSTPKWIATEGTFRPPYYRRNKATEISGLLHGSVGDGPQQELAPGGLSYQAAYMPHGGTYETWVAATTGELRPEVVYKDTVAFMLHIGVPILLTEWAMEGAGSKVLREPPPMEWDVFEAHFLHHLDEVNRDLAAAGLPALHHPR